jgi:hypothetical protein
MNHKQLGERNATHSAPEQIEPLPGRIKGIQSSSESKLHAGIHVGAHEQRPRVAFVKNQRLHHDLRVSHGKGASASNQGCKPSTETQEGTFGKSQESGSATEQVEDSPVCFSRESSDLSATVRPSLQDCTHALITFNKNPANAGFSLQRFALSNNLLTQI